MPSDARVIFSNIGGPQAINPFGSASEALEKLLPRKNEQLNVQGRLRELLIISAGVLQSVYAIRHYFSTRSLEDFPNIDKVFFASGPNNISLVFDRRVFDCYRDGSLPEREALDVLFFPFLEHRLSSHDEKAFIIVQKISARYGSLDRLSVDGKDALISCGERFAQEENWSSVCWIIEQLKNDPDPPFPNSMHDREVAGEVNRLITSVRGRLCWLIQKVVVHNLIEQYDPMLNILEEYALGPDFYMRSQCCVPLCEMAVRRYSTLPGDTRFMPEQTAERIKCIAFRMLREAGRNRALLSSISAIFQSIVDLTEEEAVEVIDRLSVAEELNALHTRCSLLLYFALFRENHFRASPKFNSEVFKDRLRQELGGGNSEFRQSLMWHMAGGVENETLPYDLLPPYLEAFLSGPYEGTAYLHLLRICETHIKDHAENLCPIVSAALAKLTDFIAVDPASRSWSFHELWDVLDLIVNNCGEDCVLGAIERVLERDAALVGVSGKVVAGMLAPYKSARAEEIKGRYASFLGE